MYRNRLKILFVTCTRLFRTNIVKNCALNRLQFRLLYFSKVNFSKFTSNVRYPRLTHGKLKTMKLDTPEFQALFTPELKELVALFEKNNYEIRIAGGAVRDLLMSKEINDVDFATTATPDQMKEMFELAGIRMINAKGESHGTITARINDKENFEVTTLRIDIRTDGRHAEVQFTKDWHLDAARRDLTINSMFLGFDGTVHDYFNGMEDVEKKCVKFVGEPADRIQEDYLRILRYFRFFGRYAKTATEHEEAALTAIKENAEGMKMISGERIWMEFKKIVVGNHAAGIIQTMADTGVTQYMGFSKDLNVQEFQVVCKRTTENDPAPMTRIAALLATEEQVYSLNDRLKVSTEELKTLLFIIMNRDRSIGNDINRHFKHLTAETSGKDKKVKDRVCELLKYKGYDSVLKDISDWQLPQFPVNGMDLQAKDLKKGPIFAKTLNALRRRWIKSDFVLTKEELIKQIDEVINEIKA